ncbi:ABC transporter permease [Rubrobacter aplysinae]|uniref:ABC transporter permease n=1 Tax=Rubrobacter aplysinae TaxID=909625 RepID=UPI00064C3BCB|nr:hypothetical protein [Rubrobacter aplysinae]
MKKSRAEKRATNISSASGADGVAAAAVAGSALYEFRMQIRRKAVWVVLALFSLWALTGNNNPWDFPPAASLTDVVVTWAGVVQLFMPIALGCMIADRLPRDRRTGVSELLDTLPASPGGRLVGKYLGATLATTVPVFILYAAGIAYVVVDRGEWLAVPLALAAFAAVNIPGLLFVGAFSVACPTLLRVPLYQFLFVGYWFWGNALNPDSPIPTLSGTWLTPAGGYMSSGFFGVPGIYISQAEPWEGVVSIALLLGLAAMALLTAHYYLHWRKSRR